jgi:hypothetical protein
VAKRRCDRLGIDLRLYKEVSPAADPSIRNFFEDRFLLRRNCRSNSRSLRYGDERLFLHAPIEPACGMNVVGRSDPYRDAKQVLETNQVERQHAS